MDLMAASLFLSKLMYVDLSRITGAIDRIAFRQHDKQRTEINPSFVTWFETNLRHLMYY